MPYTFLFMMGAFLLIPVCFAGTFILCLFTLPLLYKKRNRESSSKLRVTKRILLSLFFAILAAIVIPFFFLLLGGICLSIDSMHAQDYWRYNGALDYFRMPLEPPYELVMIDTIDDASIDIWKEDSVDKLSGITRYEKRGYLIFGERTDERWEHRRIEKDREWFVFDLGNGDKSIFKSEEDFAAELANRGVENIKLKTVLENWKEYWKHPRRKASEKPKDVIK